VEPTNSDKPAYSGKPRGRHPKNCQCDKHRGEALLRSAKAQLIPVGEGRNPPLLTREEALDADGPLIAPMQVDDKGRERLVRYIELRALYPDKHQKDIAPMLGMTANALAKMMQRAVEAGKLKFHDPLERLEHEIIPKTVANLSEFLDQKDKTVTIEVAKGTIFKNYLESKGISEKPVTILALKLETVDSNQTKVLSSSIVGVPKVIDAQVVEVKEDAI
jgi:hypothetical protein